MRVLITGGAGFIGSHLCDHLIERGNDLLCVDNLITGTIDNISHLKEKIRFYKQDVTDYLDFKEDIDWILHFASPASPVDYLKYPIQTLKVGSLGTHKTLGLAKAKGAKFLLASTSEVYGDPTVSPQDETYWGNVNPIGPRGVYDEAKRFAEAIVMAYHRTHGLDTRIVRIFNTYGPRMRLNDGRVVPAFISQALKGEPLTVFGDGLQTRSFCYISDLVEGIVRLMEVEIHIPINLGNPEELTILDFAKRIGEIVGGGSPIEYMSLPIDDPKQRRPDIKLAEEKLGWRPKVQLNEGLAKTIEWFVGVALTPK